MIAGLWLIRYVIMFFTTMFLLYLVYKLYKKIEETESEEPHYCPSCNDRMKISKWSIRYCWVCPTCKTKIEDEELRKKFQSEL